MNHSEIREFIVDGTAAAIVLTGMYMAANNIAIMQEYVALLGVASMYLFGKYTPNSA